MRYYLAVVEKNDSQIFAKISQEKNGGVFTFYVIEQAKVYQIYNSQGQSLVSSWRRGISIEDNPDLKRKIDRVIKDSKNEHQITERIIEIRRGDFRQVVTKLKNSASVEIKQSYCIVKEQQLSVWHNHNDRLYADIIDFKKEQRSLEAIYKKIQKFISHHLRSDSSLEFRADDFRKAPSFLEAIAPMLSDNIDSHWYGTSYRTIILLQLVGSILSDCYENSKSVFYFPNKGVNKDDSSSHATLRKIRRVLIVTNSAGSPLPGLSQNLLWSDVIKGFAIKIIEADFTRERFINFFEDGQNRKRYDAIVYRGHSQVHSEKIAWQCSDGLFVLPENFCSHYIHLACLKTEQHNDLKVFPAGKNILPFGEVNDRFEPIDFLTNFFNLLRQGSSFQQSFFESKKYISKRFGVFNYIKTTNL